MNGLSQAFALGSEQIIQLVLVILAVIIVLFMLRFVVNIAVSLLRVAIWIGLAIIILYVAYTLLQGRLG